MNTDPSNLDGVLLGRRRKRGGRPAVDERLPEGAAVGVVPPVAHEHLLVEDRPLGTEEAVLSPIVVAVVVDLG